MGWDREKLKAMDGLWRKILGAVRRGVPVGGALCLFFAVACSNRPAGEAGSTEKGKDSTTSGAIRSEGKGGRITVAGPGERSEAGDFEDDDEDDPEGDRDDG
jgi:hypothetical protein